MIDLRGLLYTEADGHSWVEVDLDEEAFIGLIMDKDEFDRRSLFQVAFEIAYYAWRPVEAFETSGVGEAYVKRAREFDRVKMGRQRLWIRGQYGDDVNEAVPPFKLCNGNHRSLVYAVYLMMGVMKYEPVQALLQLPGRRWQEVE